MRCTGGLDLPERLRQQATRIPRVDVPELPLTKRNGFDEVILTMTPAVAQAEAARCLRCDQFCSICTSVCPHQAFLTYQSKPFSADLATWTVRGGRAMADKPQRFAVIQASQTAVLTDFCNECGNCATFCPTAGRPYVDKPRLYVSKSEFEAQADNAFRITGSGAARKIAGRFGGATHELAPQGAGYVYRAPGLSVALDANLKPQSAPEVSAAEGATLGLVPAAILATLLRGIAPEQLPVEEEKRSRSVWGPQGRNEYPVPPFSLRIRKRNLAMPKPAGKGQNLNGENKLVCKQVYLSPRHAKMPARPTPK